MEAEEALNNSFIKASTAIIPDRDIIWKGFSRSKFLMDINVKIQNEILANLMQKCIKRIVYHTQAEFIPGMQDHFNIKRLINVSFLRKVLSGYMPKRGIAGSYGSSTYKHHSQ